MRTTLNLDDELMTALLAKYPDKSKTAAVETAIAADLERDAAEGLRAMAGRIEIDDYSEASRTAEERRAERLDRRWHGNPA